VDWTGARLRRVGNKCRLIGKLNQVNKSSVAGVLRCYKIIMNSANIVHACRFVVAAQLWQHAKVKVPILIPSTTKHMYK